MVRWSSRLGCCRLGDGDDLVVGMIGSQDKTALTKNVKTRLQMTSLQLEDATIQRNARLVNGHAQVFVYKITNFAHATKSRKYEKCNNWANWICRVHHFRISITGTMSSNILKDSSGWGQMLTYINDASFDYFCACITVHLLGLS